MRKPSTPPLKRQTHPSRSNADARTGATAVEFAITVGVLFVLLLGGIELYRTSMLQQSADHAAQVAARRAIIPGATAGDAIGAAQRHLQIVGIRNAKIEIEPAVLTNDTAMVRTNVTVPVPENSYLVPTYFDGDVFGRSRMITERPPIEMRKDLPRPPPPPPPPGSKPKGGGSSGGSKPSKPSKPPGPPKAAPVL